MGCARIGSWLDLAHSYSLMTPDTESHNTVYFLFMHLSQLCANVINYFLSLPDSVSMNLGVIFDPRAQHSVWFIVNTKEFWSLSHLTPPAQGDVLKGKARAYSFPCSCNSYKDLHILEGMCVCVF